jgi:hypothetical protein
MTRAEKEAIQARVAVRVFALQAARDAMKASIRAHGLKLHSFSARDLSVWAEVWLEEHPETFAEARAKAVKLGYAG